MEAYPIYKCRRCGGTVVGEKITDPQEYGAVDTFKIHDCEEVGTDAGTVVKKVGLAKLVGYDEFS